MPFYFNLMTIPSKHLNPPCYTTVLMIMLENTYFLTSGTKDISLLTCAAVNFTRRHLDFMNMGMEIVAIKGCLKAGALR